MSVEATSALTFGDLILATARQMGVAFYGDNGDEAAQIPIDDHDLAECKTHVNNAIRMFIADAPASGWRWTRPAADVILWPSVAVSATRTLTGGVYDAANDQTLLTANMASFYESMEEKAIVVTGHTTYTVKRYVSGTQVYVYGNATFAVAATFSIAADGNYTLPRTFAGAFSGKLSFGSATNRAVSLEWIDESVIRTSRENVSIQTGTPRGIALDLFAPTNGQRRRYRLAVYPTPDEVFTVQFPYDLHFDTLTDASDIPPTPIAHDETLRAACLAVVERDVDDIGNGPKMGYYQKCLNSSANVDVRTAPKKLGYFGNAKATVTPRNFRDFMQRPTVSYNTP